MLKHFITISSIICLLAACNNDKATATTAAASSNSVSIDNAQGNTGFFTANQTNYTGEVSTQYFGSKEKGNFSVLCQQDTDDGKFTLLQTTFLTEMDARENKQFTLYHQAILPMTAPAPGFVTVSLSGNGEELGATAYTGSSKSTGSITIKNHILRLKDVLLFNQEGKEQVINATIPF